MSLHVPWSLNALLTLPTPSIHFPAVWAEWMDGRGTSGREGRGGKKTVVPHALLINESASAMCEISLHHWLSPSS